MAWSPLQKQELSDDILTAYQQMTTEQKRLWNLIAIPLEKWAQHPWGDEGGGFWVVAVIGKRCLYYNDIEEGYNWSAFTEWGVIDEYWCDQDELGWATQRIFTDLLGQEPLPRLGPAK